MSRKNKNITLRYMAYPFIFIVVITALVYLSGRPLLAMARANLNMIITKGAPSYPNEYNSEFNGLFVQDGRFDPNTIQIPEFGAHYGNIRCERINLTVPLYYGDSDTILEKGAGQYVAGGLPGEGRPVLVGGHDTVYFAPLEYIKDGDIVQIDTNYGIFQYVVTDIKIAEADDASAYPLYGEKEQLILYTCYPFKDLLGNRSQRYFVYCDRDMKEQQNER